MGGLRNSVPITASKRNEVMAALSRRFVRPVVRNAGHSKDLTRKLVNQPELPGDEDSQVTDIVARTAGCKIVS